MQLATGLLRVVHAADSGADLEAQCRLVAQTADESEQVVRANMERDLAAIDHDALDSDVE